MENNLVNLDDIFNKVKEIENNKKSNVKLDENIKEVEIKTENIDLDKEVVQQESSDKKIEESQQIISEKENEFENLKKELSSKDKALNDTKRIYQIKNQENVLFKKKFKSTIEELQKSILDPDNTYLDVEEFNAAVNKLTSIFDFKEEELETKDEISKADNKSKTILEKLENEFQNFKKYNKSKEIDNNYKAFYDSVHLLNIDERESLLEYLEEAEPTDAIERLLMLGQDYRNSFEKGLKKHKNIFAFVNSLQDEISKLNEEINNYKQSIDNKFEESDNKQIKSRYSMSDTDNSKRIYSEYDKSLLKSLNILR
jgi:DNA repair exonuclease SbcCD ATPase subunit